MPPVPRNTDRTDPDHLARLLQIMAKLRDPHSGCEWDLAQDFRTIMPYTIEEAYEVADAIERGDLNDLKDELGDLLLQVVFHARIAEEEGHFTFNDVAGAISDKMESRHPHIFGEESGTMGEARWEALKAAERGQKGVSSSLDGVAKALPALMRALKLQKRAAGTGFDWPDPSGPQAKIEEEMQELADAKTKQDRFEEAGDFLFAAVNLVRAYGVDAEEALRAANAKFERRFRALEALGGEKFAELPLVEQEKLWQRIKSSEKNL